VNDLRVLRRSVLLFHTAGALALALSVQQPEFSLASVLIVLLWSGGVWWITRKRARGLRGGVAAVLAFLSGAIVALLVFSVDGLHGAPRALGGATVGAVALMLCARSTARGECNLALAGAVPLLVAAVESDDLAVGLFVVLACVLAVDIAIRVQVARVMQVHDRAEESASVRGSRARAVSGAGFSRDLRRLVTLAGVATLLIGAALFVVFPRSPTPTRGWFSGGGGDRSGFAEAIALGNPRRIDVTEQEVLSVEWRGPGGRPAQVAGALRLRGLVLERYDTTNMAWHAAGADRAEVILCDDGDWHSLSARPVDERVNTYTLRVSVLRDPVPVVFSAWLPIAMKSATPHGFVLNPRTTTLRVLDFESVEVPRAYETRVQPYASPDALDAVLGLGTDRPRLPSFPVPAVVEFANRLLAEAGEHPRRSAPVLDQTLSGRWERNQRVARLFERELASDRYRYTTDLRAFAPREGRDMNDLFLNEYRFGHCEYFASAFAALCQASGVDARIVTGFLVADQSPADGVYSVRESHAHAWVEVRTGRAQWTAFDPTPAARAVRAQAAGESWWDLVQVLLRPLESAWRRDVARFDAAAQSTMFATWRGRIDGVISGGRELVAAIVPSDGERSAMGIRGWIWIGSVVITGALGVAIVALSRRHRAQTRRALGLTPRDRARARATIRDGSFFAQALAALDAAGFPRVSGTTPRAYQRAIYARHQGVGNAFERIVDRFYEVRFGSRRPDAARRAADLALVDALRAALNGATL
jgi:transglutaminase-like putative cysteine protease